MNTQKYNSLLEIKAALDRMFERFNVPSYFKKSIADDSYCARSNEWAEECERKYGDYSSSFLASMKKSSEMIKEIRSESRSMPTPSFEKKIEAACRRCSSKLSEVLYSNEGRAYDWYYSVAFNSHDSRNSRRPNIKIMGKTYSGAYKCRMNVTPAWEKRVGINRGCFTLNGTRTFMLDSEEFSHPALNDQGVTCLRAKVFGIMGDAVYKHLSSRIQNEILDAESGLERAEAVDKDADLRLRHEEKHPVEYTAYYLEHTMLKNEDGTPVFAVGVTVDKAKALMDRRIKAETIRALGL